MELDDYIKRIDERAEKLIEDFDGHRKEVKNVSGLEDSNDRLIFEGWTIQKLAGLQVILEDLSEKINGIDLLPGEN